MCNSERHDQHCNVFRVSLWKRFATFHLVLTNIRHRKQCPTLILFSQLCPVAVFNSTKLHLFSCGVVWSIIRNFIDLIILFLSRLRNCQVTSLKHGQKAPVRLHFQNRAVSTKLNQIPKGFSICAEQTFLYRNWVLMIFLRMWSQTPLVHFRGTKSAIPRRISHVMYDNVLEAGFLF